MRFLLSLLFFILSVTSVAQSYNNRYWFKGREWDADFQLRTISVNLNARLIFKEDAYLDSALLHKTSDVGVTLGWTSTSILDKSELFKYKSSIGGPSLGVYYSKKIGPKLSFIGYTRADIHLLWQDKFRNRMVSPRTTDKFVYMNDHPFNQFTINPGAVLVWKRWLNIYFEYPLTDLMDITVADDYLSLHPTLFNSDFNIQSRFIIGIGIWLAPTLNSFNIPWVKVNDRKWSKSGI